MYRVIFFILLVPFFTFGQKLVKINNSSELESVVFEDNTTYLLKAGEEYNLSKNIQILDVENVTIDSYGNGEPPFIKLNEGVEGDAIYIRACRNVTIKNLKVFGNFDNSVIHISGHFVKTANHTNNVTIRNCELSQGFNGIRSLPYQTKCDTINIISCNIHHTNDDGIFIMDCNDVTIDSCHIWHVNLAWLRGGPNSGDCIHLINNCNNWSVKHNLFDRRLTSNKFCFIYGTNDYKPMQGELIGNTFYPPKDTADSNGGCIYISFSEYVKIEDNKFFSDGYQWGGKPGGLAHVSAKSVDFNDNYIEGLTYCRFTPEVEKVNLFKNTFVDSKSVVFYYANECNATDNVFYNLKGWAYSAEKHLEAKLNDTNTVYLEGYPENLDSLLNR